MKRQGRPVVRALRGYAYLLPMLLILGGMVAWPVAEAWRMSFHDIYLLRGGGRETFIGLDNYIRFFRDPDAPEYLLNTGIFVVGGVGGQFVVAMILALLLNTRLMLRGFWRALAVIPWAMPITVTVMVWRWILDGQWGILNYVLMGPSGNGTSIDWLSSNLWLWPTLLVVNAWAGFPFVFVNLLAGLQGIPRELIEAARIDGAGPWTLYWRITLPMLRPVITTLLLLSVIMHLREFATIWMLTSGGPGISTTTLSPLVYVTSFRFFRLGYGAAIGVLLMLVTLAFTAAYLRRVRVEVA
jgi:multiple sugar transport system permease protein